MKKRNLIIFITSFFVFFLFFNCKHFEPELCYVTISSDEHCTYELEKQYVPKNSFVKIKIFTETRYRISLSGTDEYFKSPDEENTYYVLITKSVTNIRITGQEKWLNDVNYHLKHCSIDYNKWRTYEGDTVTFTITPDKYFLFDASTIKIQKHRYWNYEDDDINISFEQSENNPNEFSFIMPDDDVDIYADIKFGITATSQKECFAQGEKIIFDIINYFPNQTYDLVLSENYWHDNLNNKIEIANNIYLSDTYELPQNLMKPEDTGGFILCIYPHGQTSPSTEAVLVVNSDNTPEGWRSIGIKKRYDSYNYSSKLYTIDLNLSNPVINYNTYINFKYTLENTTTFQKEENSISLEYDKDHQSCKLVIRDKKNIDLDAFDTITVWIEDEDLKFISRKITVNLKTN